MPTMMPPRLRRTGLALLLAICAAQLGCKRNKMRIPIAPTVEQLEQAYRTPNPLMGGHQGADAVLVGSDGVTVLAYVNPDGDVMHTWLLQLGEDGKLRREWHYPPEYGMGRAIAPVTDGGFVIAGEVARGSMAYQASLMLVGAKGEVVAPRSFGPPDVTGFKAVAVLSDGSIVAGGQSSWKGWLVHVDAKLQELGRWQLDDVHEVGYLIRRADGGWAMAALQEWSTTRSGLGRIATFAADGAARWQTRLPKTGRGEPAALVSSVDGGLFVVGSGGDGDEARMWVARLSERGALVWQRTVGPADERRGGSAVALLNDGALIVVGNAQHGERYSLRYARLDAGGAVEWERAYDDGGDCLATDAAATADGGFVVVGSTTKGAGRSNVLVLRFDGRGQLVWKQVFTSAVAKP
jgi:hypothetical protein